jgi:hypothetical protein
MLNATFSHHPPSTDRFLQIAGILTRTVKTPTPRAVAALGVQQPGERGCDVSGRFSRQ